ncbi:MAG: hypothetical protein PVI18_13220 [Desulfobacterales bacterium]
MRSLCFSLWAALTILFAGLFLFSDATADDQTCVLKAGRHDVHVYAWDEDKNRERMDEVFEGWIKAGQEVQIRSQTGLITYSYQEKSDDRSTGDNHAECKNGNTIRVP